MENFYNGLAAQAEALTDGVPYETANLANLAALLWHALPDINWAGFYILRDGALVLGPFQGKPACIRIPMGKGVCGTAAAENRVVLVEDVHTFPGHIACDQASNSEIVLPLYRGGKLFGVLDVDSPTVCRFTAGDGRGLSLVAEVISRSLAGWN